jgi:GNAT superfamily N-acetyltransferase
LDDASAARSRRLDFMIFSDLALSRRLERAEGFACAQYAQSRRKQFPTSKAEWVECGGAYAVFDGVSSPCTQTFGLGIFEELSEKTLDQIELFFLSHAAPVVHEVSPFAGVAALDLLCRRGYRPIELSSVMFQPIVQIDATRDGDMTVRITGPEEAELWSKISARGWSPDHPELLEFMKEFGAVTAAREQTVCFLAEADGIPGAAGVMTMHEGIALFGGASTIPELRKRGLQTALLEARMRCAFDRGCDLAMMVALPGSDSQRNAERRGFQIAYTRTKWQLFA